VLAHSQFFVLVGVQGGGIWIIRLGGCLPFQETPPHVPQTEAREEIPPSRKESQSMFPFQSPQDRPDPMEEPPPQDDDPNFSALNPMRSPLLSRDLIFEGLFFKNWGWASGGVRKIFEQIPGEKAMKKR